eukprot:gnl/MRDRNA2_/MRDRNA2_61628_c0_seq1.p1 gnl/MRDRNA2_/MRDRNA2_61628_c0~~gnl/MRDRNA2_/MRDRNA2_61628_c0_seq1.p1  ORF type:complete len:179 (-),score=18.50 gnl/MRDRNA2_/MRDRNA2_61628_c0_seq1:523-1059(-)
MSYSGVTSIFAIVLLLSAFHLSAGKRVAEVRDVSLDVGLAGAKRTTAKSDDSSDANLEIKEDAQISGHLRCCRMKKDPQGTNVMKMLWRPWLSIKSWTRGCKSHGQKHWKGYVFVEEKETTATWRETGLTKKCKALFPDVGFPSLPETGSGEIVEAEDTNVQDASNSEVHVNSEADNA